MSYLLVEWLHIVSAMVAVGANATYGVWLARAKRQPAVLPFTLRSVKWIDDRLANPAYAVLLVTGLGMAHLGRIPLSTPWLATALTLYVLVTLIALLGYTPTLRKQIEALDSTGLDSPEYRVLASRAGKLGGVLAVMVLAIVYMMVVKPVLWG